MSLEKFKAELGFQAAWVYFPVVSVYGYSRGTSDYYSRCYSIIVGAVLGWGLLKVQNFTSMQEALTFQAITD